ncbi:MAG: ArsR family transcriptional regulator [Streptosporangiaceae bacterium]|jgi:DNA-binding transcriptional ArsR family regulator|nr:ArsR family transcriptional regulator [Streptosporangiaceae bacterium]
MSAAATPLHEVLRALADGNRRSILEVVRDRPRPVGEIAYQVEMSQQAVSHHLSVLRGAGLVTSHREGTRHLFLVDAGGLGVVQEFLDGFWPAQLTALKRVAEAAASRPAGSDDD